jgi:iron complex transport system substrate-binding protein
MKSEIKMIHKFLLLSCVVTMLFTLTACVDQSGGGTVTKERKEEPVNTAGKRENLTILATSMATVSLCEKLDLPLAGIPDSDLMEPPERYKDLPKIGMAMSPDMEIVSSLQPDWILSPVSLISDLQPKYEAINTDYAFLNLSSVAGMYKSIEELGTLFNREAEAAALVKEFTDFYDAYKESHGEKEAPTVLLLMGLPGSYVVATENSYAGNLVKLAGGINVYQKETADFITVNTEDMLTKDPDIILRTAHAMPDMVMEMFKEEFKTNDIWKNFRAVQEDRVYDLTPGNFGMSATFGYPEALKELDLILYGEGQNE